MSAVIYDTNIGFVAEYKTIAAAKAAYTRVVSARQVNEAVNLKGYIVNPHSPLVVVDRKTWEQEIKHKYNFL